MIDTTQDKEENKATNIETNSTNPVKKTKIMGVASLGGHRMQLLRILEPLAQEKEITFVSTRQDAQPLEGSPLYGCPFYILNDFNRKDAWKLLTCYKKACKILDEVKPDVVITTGAAPGVIALLAAKMKGIKTIWIDSIANVDTLSMSGKLASKFATKTLTQWKHLVTDKIEYHGQVIS